MDAATAAPAPASAVPAPESAQAVDAEDLMAAELAALREERGAEGGAGASPLPATVPATGDVAAAVAAATAPALAPAADPAEVLRQTQHQLQQARSELGRVGQLNRLLHETRAERDRLTQENASLKRAAPSPEQQLGEDAAARLSALAEKARGFPELEGLVGAVQAALRASHAQGEAVIRQKFETELGPLQDLRAEQAQRQQEQKAAAFDAAMQTFQTTYPNAVEVIRTPEFNAWIGTQPQPIKAAFYQGQDPGEAIAVMDAYDAHLRRAGKAPIAVHPQQQAAAHRSSANAARLTAAAGLPSRSGAGSKGALPPEDDFEASLDFFRRQRLANAQRAV